MGVRCRQWTTSTGGVNDSASHGLEDTIGSGSLGNRHARGPGDYQPGRIRGRQEVPDGLAFQVARHEHSHRTVGVHAFPLRVVWLCGGLDEDKYAAVLRWDRTSCRSITIRGGYKEGLYFDDTARVVLEANVEGLPRHEYSLGLNAVEALPPIRLKPRRAAIIRVLRGFSGSSKIVPNGSAECYTRNRTA